jgi:hypothetical protein
MRVTLGALFERHYPSLMEGIHWQIIYFQGKADLAKNFPNKMRSWSHLSPHFVILRDNDGADCQALKESLRLRAAPTGKPFHIRLVCQELEAWFLGDLAAVEAAYPSSKATRFQDSAKYQNPDKITNASEELARLTSIRGKTSKASAIARHLDLARNRSRSIKVLFRTLADFFPATAFRP